MNSFYANTLYPLQDKVLKSIASLKTPFYLTGGTALSRFYFNHRYSDDLDLFVNQDPQFVSYVEKILLRLTNFDLVITNRSESYYSLKINELLKIDFINDTAGRVGLFKKTTVFSQVDSLENILANKISALVSREEAKDVVDLWIIAQNQTIDWEKTFLAVNSKAAGIFPPAVAEKIATFPAELINQIKWVDKPPNLKTFKLNLDEIVKQILAF